MGRKSLCDVDNEELIEILNKSTSEEIFEYAFRYLRQKELSKLRKRKQREGEESQNEKDKC